MSRWQRLRTRGNIAKCGRGEQGVARGVSFIESSADENAGADYN